MKKVSFPLLAACVATFALAQSHYVDGHYSKSGKWIPGHAVKDRKPSEKSFEKSFSQSVPKKKKTPQEIAQDQGAKGKHREHRYFEGHYGKDGRYIKPHWQWIWVKG